jgi:uncharacterized protein
MNVRMQGSLALLAVALLAGCASPPSRFYTLSGAAPAPSAAGPSVAVGPVSIPAVVDRPEIVVTVGPNEVWLDEYNRWASPLADGIGLAVAQNLAAALPSSRVTLLGQAGDAELRVAIEVQRFESAPGAFALFDAAWTVRRPSDGAARSGRTTARENLTDGSYDAVAAAHSRALARLGQDVTQAIAALPPAATTRPTPSPVR